ncbi:MAG: 16S rRNA (cytidine(1402)-2'-O)-methyltransferase [Clostridia bacterium]|nr:16S rRNA (cytidine(1402)-2'-O)-methyltransferase [Clostridia bacterium]
MNENTAIGTLYIVATPIGNSRDMSPRGIEILTNVDMIAAEDTRRSMILMNKLEIKNKLVSNHKFNEYGKTKYFINEMLSGKSVAVITDAGTPCISDPGNELIKSAIEAGIRVVGIPGACAAVTALSISGFDLSTFLFYGFFPRENSERRKLLEQMRKGAGTRTFAFYESPKRIMSTVDFFIDSEAQCRMCLCNDLTKLHEMTFRGTPEEVKQQLLTKGNYEKGEFALIVEIDKEYIFNKVEHIFSPEAMLVDVLVKEACSVKDAIKLVLKDENNSYSKNELYAASLNLKELFG